MVMDTRLAKDRNMVEQYERLATIVVAPDTRTSPEQFENYVVEFVNSESVRHLMAIGATQARLFVPQDVGRALAQ